MAWSKIFKGATIKKLNVQAYILKITYSYYWLYDFDEVFVFSTYEEARTKFALERSHNQLTLEEEDGTHVPALV